MDKLEHYLDRVCRGIGGPKSLRQHVRQELREHLLDAVAEHRAAGLSEEEALTRALEDFGGPEQLRSELEATHGHRLLPMLIDRAMQWKENTLKAKWLWTSWAYLAVTGVIAVAVLFLTFSAVALVPKLRKIQSDGWLDVYPDFREPGVAWLNSVLEGVAWASDNMWWCLMILMAGWGLFEWRVHSENKAFMRLSALGTAALGLTVMVVLTATALVVPLSLGLPGMYRISTPMAIKQMATIESSVSAIDQAMAKEDWPAIQEHLLRATRAIARLEEAAGAIPVPTSPAEKPRVDELRARLKSANECLLEAQQAIRAKDTDRLKGAMQKFHELYGPVGNAAAKEER